MNNSSDPSTIVQLEIALTDFHLSLQELHRVDQGRGSPEYASDQIYQENWDRAARSFIRTAASSAEAWLSITTAHVCTFHCQRLGLTPCEIRSFLYDSDVKLRFRDAFKACVTAVSRRTGEPSIAFNSKQWADLILFFEHRGRLMHPTSLDRFRITEDDVIRAEQAFVFVSATLDHVEKACNRYVGLPLYPFCKCNPDPATGSP